jgi:hypothetical protein
MKTTLLRFAARRPLVALGLTLGLGAVAVGAATTCALHHKGGAAPAATQAAGSPRAILGRLWFDKYPEKRSDEVQFFLFLGGGIGLYEKGSMWRSSMDWFELERRGDVLDMKWLADGKTASSKFVVSACDDKPPFDLCLDFVDAPRGEKRWYGFGDLDDEAARVPWAKDVQRAAEIRGKR